MKLFLRPVRLLTIPLLVVAATACGGSDDAAETATDDVVESADAADSSSADESDEPAEPASSSEFSGGVIAGDLGRTCELLTADTVAATMGVEATSQLISSDATSGLCSFGADGSVAVSVYLPEDAVGIVASDWISATFEARVSEGASGGQSEFGGLPRAAWTQDGTATVAIAADPYYIELIDSNDQDVALTALLGELIDALS
jgi:hypothetical protein